MSSFFIFLWILQLSHLTFTHALSPSRSLAAPTTKQSSHPPYPAASASLRLRAGEFVTSDPRHLDASLTAVEPIPEAVPVSQSSSPAILWTRPSSSSTTLYALPPLNQHDPTNNNDNDNKNESWDTATLGRDTDIAYFADRVATISTEDSLVSLEDGDNDSETTSVTYAPPQSRTNLLAVGALALGILTVMSRLDWLPPPFGTYLTDTTTSSNIPYTDAYLLQDCGMTLVLGALAYAFVQSIVYSTTVQSWIDPRDARKLIHTLSAPLFMLGWPTFSPTTGAHWWAASIPLLNAGRLWQASRNASSLAQTVSRSGSSTEATGGPLIYVSVVALAVLWGWRSSPMSIVALSTMAVGDGLADLVGRRYGASNAWPGLQKSVAGSLAFWWGSWSASWAFLQWMSYWGCLTLPSNMSMEELILRLGVITLGSAVLELVPVADDNYTVPLSAAFLTWLLLPV
jgi:phytol kinase